MQDLFNYPNICDIAFDWNNEKLKNLIQSFIINLNKSKPHALIPACGTGRFSQYFSEFADIQAFDINVNTIEFAKKHRSRSNINYYVDDMKELNYSQRNDFDFVLILNNSIQYLKSRADFKCFLKNIKNKLSKESVIIIEMGLNWNGENLNKPYSWTAKRGNEEVKIDWTALSFNQGKSLEIVKAEYKDIISNEHISFESEIEQTIWNYETFFKDVADSNMKIEKILSFPNFEDVTDSIKNKESGRFIILLKNINQERER